MLLVLIRHLLGLEDILVIPSTPSDMSTRSYSSMLPPPPSWVLFNFIFISAIRAELLQPLAELCIPRCSDLTTELTNMKSHTCSKLAKPLRTPTDSTTDKNKNKNNSFGLCDGLFIIHLYKVWFGSVV
jgi:hypothetical protein